MKTILVSLDQYSYSQAVLEIALILGRSFESYIEGFARGSDLHNLIAVEVPLAVPLSAEVPPQQMVESVHQQFRLSCVGMPYQKLLGSRTGCRSAGSGMRSRMRRSSATTVARSTSLSLAALDRTATVRAWPVWRKPCLRVAGRFWLLRPLPPRRWADRL